MNRARSIQRKCNADVFRAAEAPNTMHTVRDIPSSAPTASMGSGRIEPRDQATSPILRSKLLLAGRATRSGSATARQSSLACPFSKPHPRHTATARVPSAHASSAHGRERNACGMRWRQSRARLSREKLLHLVESFLKSTHVILRKNERNNTLLGGTDDKLDPRPSTYREMRDVRRFRLRHGADDLPGVRLRLHRLRPEVD